MKTKKTLITLAVIAVVLLTAFILQQIIMFCVSFAMLSASTREIVEVLSSPDGRLVAYMFTLDQGAMGDCSYHLTIRPSWMPAPKEGLRAFGPRAGNTFVSHYAFETQWLGNKALLITVVEDDIYDAGLYKQKKFCFGTRISYCYA